MKRKLWTLLLALGAALALCVGASAADFLTGWDEVTNSTTTLESGKQYYLNNDVTVSQTITVRGTVTLDLNGHVLKYESANNGSVIVVEGSGQLTIEDSNTSNLSHRFNPNGKLWVLDDASGTEAVTGGVITGGTGYPFTLTSSTVVYYGGGVYIASGGQLTMTGGNIIGCSATYGGGVCTDSEQTKFSMSGGSIAGCVASNSGGGVRASGTFKMSGQAVIRSCTAESATQFVFGGGVYVNSSSSFEMSGEAKIKGCQAISNSSYSSNGGGVYVSSSSSFVMSEKAQIEDCKAISNSFKSSNGGGVFLANGTSLALSGNAVIQNCTATNSVNSGEAYGGGVRAFYVREITLEGSASIAGCAAANGSGLYITGSQQSGYGILYANGGSVDGDVVLGDTTEGPCTITGSGETVFNGKVTVTPGSTIENGKFNGEVINNGTITGGVFNSTVSNNGTITGGVFTGTVSGSGTITGNPALITGSGTESDPYQIGTAEGLKWFRDKVNRAKTSDETKICAVLTEDIDLNNEPWTPIGIGEDTRKEDLPYSGTFDGNGHTISGLNVNYGDKNGGLFCYVKSATIKNLTVAGSVTYSSGDGIAYGGIVGCADSSTIENCTNRCTVTGNWYAGGIVGWSTDSDIIGCANFGNISSPSFSGGICGKIGGENDAAGIDATIRDCYNVGMVSGNYAGGITGQSDSEDIDILIANCYNVGSLHGSTNTGEIIGDLSGPICTTIDNCYYLPTGNPASTSDRVNVKRTDSKTAAEFADGTVLNLLINGRADSEHPWYETCIYLEAAGKTLPVFKWQHQHQLTHVLAKDPTTSEVGNIEYWYCPVCGKYFADANGDHEITQAETVIPKRQSSGGGSGGSSSYPITVPSKTENGTVTVSPKNASAGSTVTITVKPDSGYVLETISVTDKNGNDLKLTDKSNGKYTFTMPTSKVEIKVTFMEDNSVLNFFYDVPNDAYYYEAVKWAAENGITGGVGNSLFAPNQPCTRAQIVTFLWRAAGSPVVNYLMPFTDVDEGAYYAEAVRWAASCGIVTGLTETTFGTNNVCTRAQAAAMIYRYAQAQGKGFTGAWMFLLPFTDVPEWAYESVAWCYMNGVTTGVSETAFAPGSDCTRAQIVTFLWRAFSK